MKRLSEEEIQERKKKKSEYDRNRYLSKRKTTLSFESRKRKHKREHVTSANQAQDFENTQHLKCDVSSGTKQKRDCRENKVSIDAPSTSFTIDSSSDTFTMDIPYTSKTKQKQLSEKKNSKYSLKKLQYFRELNKTPHRLAQARERKKRIIKTPDFYAKEAQRSREFRLKKANACKKIDNYSREDNWLKIEKKFHEAISEGPTHRCFCCDRLFFNKNMKLLSKTDLLSCGFHDNQINFIVSVNLEFREFLFEFCDTCRNYFRSAKLPPLAANYGFRYPSLPTCLAKLSDQEERLVALHNPFLQIQIDFRKGEYSGTVWNVPIDLHEDIDEIPRSLNDPFVVRMVSNEQCHLNYMYDAKLLLEAASFLRTTSLYENVDIDPTWLKKFETETFANSSNEITIRCSKNKKANNNHSLIQTVIRKPRIEGTLDLYDDLTEILSYPKIYCGELREFTRETPPYFSEISNSELRRFDRRGATPQKVLYNYMKHLQKTSSSLVKICSKNESLSTAENVLDDNCEFHQENFPYKFLKDIKDSPEYWKEQRKRVRAMIRQIGPPTLFVTLTAAELQWYPLIKCLTKCHYGGDLTKDSFDRMITVRKKVLINQDPTLCNIYFKHKIEELFKTFKCPEGPFRNHEILHSYRRVKFQERGNPYYQTLLWLKDAPNRNDCGEIESFVDTILTCSKDNPNVDFQRKTFDEIKNEDDSFLFKRFPMDKTRLLKPVKDGDKENFQRIVKRLKEIDTWFDQVDHSFDTFLRDLKLTIDEYIYSIQCGIQKPTMFYKRDVDEVLIDPYNPKILNMMKSHMNIQYVLDAYPLVSHVGNYSHKEGPCIFDVKSEVHLRNITDEILNIFQNSMEISAREASWTLLEFPLSQITEDDIFIPTFPRDKRTKVLKSRNEIKQLYKDSTDILKDNVIDWYVNRPDEFENMTLAEFAANIEPTKNTSKEIRTRKRPKIIRFCNYNEQTDPDNFYREQVMLFTNWRDEHEEINQRDCKVLYFENEEKIKLVRKSFIHADNAVDAESTKEDALNDIVLNKNDQCLDLDFDENELKAVGCINDATQNESVTLPVRCSDKEFKQQMRLCNPQQRDIILETSYKLLRTKEQIDTFTQGAAGTGKSFTIHVLYQLLIRLFEEPDPSLPTVLLIAPTGKAACNIGGETIHHALGFFNDKYQKFSHKSLFEYRKKYKQVKCIIIDEISMVGSKMYQRIDKRLREIKGIEEPFGGVHVMKFGDLRQLEPVKDSPIYKKPRDSVENLWYRTKFQKLEQIMRQKDDQAYGCLLQNMAEGKMTQDEIAFLESKVIAEKDVPPEATLLFHTNKEVDEANRRRLHRIESKLINCYAIDKITGNVPRSRQNNRGLPLCIPLKLGAKYMLTINLNTSDRLVNGSVGILRKIETAPFQNSDGIGIKRIWLEFFENTNVGLKTRSSSHRYMSENEINSHWTPIDRFKKTIYSRKNTSLIRKQFPIDVAEAMTIHKSQGSTFRSIAVGMPKNGKMNINLQYVSLSRVQKADDFSIIKHYSPPPTLKKTDPKEVELNRLKVTSSVPMFSFLHENDQYYLYQFMYHNVQSLLQNHKDIECDYSFMNSDFLLLAETWTVTNDNFKFPNFKLCVQTYSSCNEIRKPNGVAIYAKESIKIENAEEYVNNEDGIHIAVVYLQNNIRFAVLCTDPSSTKDQILNAVKEVLGKDCKKYKTILAGDFHLEMNAHVGQVFSKELKDNYFLDLKTNPKFWTKRDYTSPDAIFSSTEFICCGVYESVFSNHVPLYGRI